MKEMRVALTVYYDENCPSCCRWADRLKMMSRGDLLLLPLRSDGLKHSLIDPSIALDQIPSIDTKNRVRYGFSTWVVLIRHLRWIWLLWPLAYCLDLSGLGQSFYLYLARNRRIKACNSTNCPRSQSNSPNSL